jgi:hypothetical protein
MAYEKSCFFSLVHRTFTSLQRSAEPIAANRVLSDLRPISRPQSNSIRFPVVHEPLKNSPIGRNEHHPRALRPGEPPAKLEIGQPYGVLDRNANGAIAALRRPLSFFKRLDEYSSDCQPIDNYGATLLFFFKYLDEYCCDCQPIDNYGATLLFLFRAPGRDVHEPLLCWRHRARTWCWGITAKTAPTASYVRSVT